MATIDDIGVPGEPADNLTGWQDAVRDMLNAHTASLAARARQLGHALRTTGQTGFTASASDLAGLAAPVTIPAGHLIRVTARVQWVQNTAAAHVYLSIREGATVLQQDIQYAVAGTNFVMTCTALLAGPAAGTHTYKATGLTTAGTADANASATAPNWLLVEDLGPLTPAT